VDKRRHKGAFTTQNEVLCHLLIQESKAAFLNFNPRQFLEHSCTIFQKYVEIYHCKTHTHTHTHTPHTYTHTHTHKHTHIHTHAHTQTHTHAHPNTHTHKHTHIHTCTTFTPSKTKTILHFRCLLVWKQSTCFYRNLPITIIIDY